MRFKDAVRTLLGLGDTVPASRAELRELRAEWLEYQAELAQLLDQLNRALMRWSKREQREAKRLAEQLATEEPTQRELPMPTPGDRKAALRARLRASGGAPVPFRRMSINGGDE